MYQYIITGDHYMAMPVHTDLNCIQMEEWFKRRVTKIHPKCSDTVFRWGSTEFINPKLKSVGDFMLFLPALV